MVSESRGGAPSSRQATSTSTTPFVHAWRGTSEGGGGSTGAMRKAGCWHDGRTTGSIGAVTSRDEFSYSGHRSSYRVRAGPAKKHVFRFRTEFAFMINFLRFCVFTSGRSIGPTRERVRAPYGLWVWRCRLPIGCRCAKRDGLCRLPIVCVCVLVSCPVVRGAQGALRSSQHIACAPPRPQSQRTNRASRHATHGGGS